MSNRYNSNGNRSNHNRNYQERNNQPNAVDKTIQAIKAGDTLKEVLVAEKYALKDGWADGIALMMGQTMKMNSNQLRKFFTEIKALEDRLDRDPVDFNKEKQLIWLLVPKIAYAAGRGLVDKKFYELTAACLTEEKIKTMEDYRAFVAFYTAIVAYTKLHA